MVEHKRLIDFRPDLVAQLHPTKNIHLNLDKITLYSHTVATWICAINPIHEWPARIADRVRGTGCPFCSSKRVSYENSLECKYPEIAKQWHPTKNKCKPSEVTAFSNQPAIWLCDNNHEYTMIIGNRTYGKQGCVECLGKVVKDDNNLAVMFPDLMNEWDWQENEKIGLNPYQLLPHSNKRPHWICKENPNHRWTASIDKRTLKKNGCPYCSNNKACIDNCLATVHPKLLEDWDWERNTEYTPYDISPNARKSPYWKCKFGHKYKMRVDHRSTGHGCKRCNNTRNSKLELFVYCELKYFYKNTEFRYNFNGYECDIYLPDYKIAIEIDGYRWHVAKQDKDKAKAEYLMNNGVTLISIRHEDLVAVSPYTIIFNTTYDKLAITKKLFDLLYTLTNDTGLLDYNHIVNEDYYISEVKRLPAPPLEKSLAFVNPNLAKKWNYIKNDRLTPEDVFANSMTVVWWLCDYGHPFERSVHSYHNFGAKCPECKKLEIAERKKKPL